MVATIRALKMHGGQPFEELTNPDVEALKKGIINLQVHLENIAKYGVPTVVAINHFASDSEEEIATLSKWCEDHGYVYSFLDGFLKGGEGSMDLARKVKETLETKESHYHPLYKKEEPVKVKIERICKEIYRADDVEFSEKSLEQIARFEKMGYGGAYICMAKTPQSLTDDPKVLGAPTGFKIHVREVNLSAGANFLVPLTGAILTMPGLPKVPAAVKMEDMPI